MRNDEPLMESGTNGKHMSIKGEGPKIIGARLISVGVYVRFIVDSVGKVVAAEEPDIAPWPA